MTSAAASMVQIGWSGKQRLHDRSHDRRHEQLRKHDENVEQAHVDAELPLRQRGCKDRVGHCQDRRPGDADANLGEDQPRPVVDDEEAREAAAPQSRQIMCVRALPMRPAAMVAMSARQWPQRRCRSRIARRRGWPRPGKPRSPGRWSRRNRCATTGVVKIHMMNSADQLKNWTSARRFIIGGMPGEIPDDAGQHVAAVARRARAGSRRCSQAP